MYNATIKIIYRDAQKMIFRVYPEAVKLNYIPGQYGALGLSTQVPRVDGSNSNGHETLIKRAYSISSSILDDQERLIDTSQIDYYEFYVDLVLVDEEKKPRLSARLFSLKDHDHIFMGPKIVGHYTLQPRLSGKNLLFIATTTGEAPHNAMIHELLAQKADCQICHIVVSQGEWVSAYTQNHQKLMSRYSHYKYIGLPHDAHYIKITQMLERWLTDPESSRIQVGWAIDVRNTHVYLCGDPQMIGAPIKLGGWRYQYPEYGLMRLLEQHQFEPATRFQQGNISHEAYW